MRGWGGTHHDSSAQADDLAPHGARYHVPIANGQECDGYQPQCVCEVPGGIDSLPMGKGNLVLRPQPGGAGAPAPTSPLLIQRGTRMESQKCRSFSLPCDLAQMFSHSVLQKSRSRIQI